jgi:sterol desaturase/sphingolipid hydroxylase (fatty acid hydroxylase superfamily)
MELFLYPTIGGVIYLFFAASIMTESYLYKRWRGRPYPWAESGVSLILAIVHGFTGYISQIVVVSAIAGLVWSLRIYTMPMNKWWAWVLVIVLEEFAYYWFHRSAHRIEYMWASHRVHHSPNELTLASAYRLAVTPVLSLSWIFFLPIVWIGFHPFTVFGILAINLAYQFWLHTTLIPKLGPIEGILNTPSAHRVHHARNIEYFDKNYGGMVMIFDRIFGTYQPEAPDIEISYGLVHPEFSLNPLWVAFGGFMNLLRDVWNAPSWRDRWNLVSKPPGWTPAATGDA